MFSPGSHDQGADFVEEADLDGTEVALVDHLRGDPVEDVRGAFRADEADGVAGVNITDLDVTLPVSGLVHGPVVAQELAGSGVLASADKGGTREGVMTIAHSPRLLENHGYEGLLVLRSMCYFA